MNSYNYVIKWNNCKLGVCVYLSRVKDVDPNCPRNEAWNGPYLSLDEIRDQSPMMIFNIINYLFIHTFWIYLLEFSVGAYK